MSEQLTLPRALAITANAFKSKLDKSGEPYFLHCIAVMNGVKHYHDIELSMIALMHDLIEDTDWYLETHPQSLYPYAIAHSRFGPIEISKRVYKGLSLITHDKHTKYEDYIVALSKNIDTVRVKIADLQHNSDITRLKGVTPKDLARIEKYHKAFLFLTAKERHYVT